MKMIHNGVIVEMTPEMIEEFEAEMAEIEVPDPEPTPEERLAVLEEQHANDTERMSALEEELLAAKILLGLEV